MALNLDILSLRSFIAVAETGGFTQAASRVHRSQSAVSMHLRKLEEQVGAVLLDRTHHGAVPTPAGARFLAEARRIVDTHDAAVSRMVAPHIAGHVRLGIMDDFASAFLPRVIAAFQRTFPDVTVQVTTGTTAAFVGKLDTQFDLVLATDLADRSSGAILRTERLFWGGMDDAPLPPSGPVRLIAMPRGNLFRDLAERRLRSARVNYRVAYEGNSIPAIEAAAAAGIGIAVVKGSTARRDLKLYGSDSGLPELPMATICLHAAATVARDPAAAALRTALEEAFRTDGPERSAGERARSG